MKQIHTTRAQLDDEKVWRAVDIEFGGCNNDNNYNGDAVGGGNSASTSDNNKGGGALTAADKAAIAAEVDADADAAAAAASTCVIARATGAFRVVTLLPGRYNHFF
jgi:hypothetical protein